jgi:hypothetical protein
MDITIHDIPFELHQALTVRATAEKTSVAKALVDAAAVQLGVKLPEATGTTVNGGPKKYRDLSFLTDGPPLEPEVIAALEEQRRIDPEMWK